MRGSFLAIKRQLCTPTKAAPREGTRRKGFCFGGWIAAWVRGSALLAGLHLLASVLPTGDTGGQVLDILVTELFGGFGSGFIRLALWPAAIRDYEGVLVLRQNAGQLFFAGVEIYSAGNMPFRIGFTAVGIEQRYFFRRDIRLQFFDGDFFVFAGVQSSRESRGGAEDKDFFHNFRSGCYCLFWFSYKMRWPNYHAQEWLNCLELLLRRTLTVPRVSAGSCRPTVKKTVANFRRFARFHVLRLGPSTPHSRAPARRDAVSAL